MAKILKTFTPTARKRGPKPKYPWAKWFDGQTWKLLPGEDFDCTLATMEDNARRAARRMEADVVVYRTEDGIVIQPESANKNQKSEGVSKSFGKGNNPTKKTTKTPTRKSTKSTGTKSTKKTS